MGRGYTSLASSTSPSKPSFVSEAVICKLFTTSPSSAHRVVPDPVCGSPRLLPGAPPHQLLWLIGVGPPPRRDARFSACAALIAPVAKIRAAAFNLARLSGMAPPVSSDVTVAISIFSSGPLAFLITISILSIFAQGQLISAPPYYAKIQKS
jgi:hypothetical protein